MPPGLTISSDGLLRGRPTESGEYEATIRAATTFGQDEEIIRFQIRGTWIQRASSSTPIYLGSSSSIAISLGGITDGVSVQWELDGMARANATDQTLVFSPFTRADIGKWVARLTLPSGETFLSPAIYLTERPEVEAWHYKGKMLEMNQQDALGDVVEVAAGLTHVVARRRDGTVTAWGLPAEAINVPAGLSDVVQVAAGKDFSLALRQDGKVIGWGTGEKAQPPPYLSDIVFIDAYYYKAVALNRFGEPITWQNGEFYHDPDMINISRVRSLAIGNRTSWIGPKNLTSVSNALLDEYFDPTSWFVASLPASSSAFWVGPNMKLYRGDWGSDWFQNLIFHEFNPEPANLRFAEGHEHGLFMVRDSGRIEHFPSIDRRIYRLPDFPLDTTGSVAVSSTDSLCVSISEQTQLHAGPTLLCPRHSIAFANEEWMLWPPIRVKNGPATYSSVDLPVGLTLDSETGQLMGTPTTIGDHSFLVRATTDHGIDELPLTLHVISPNFSYTEWAKRANSTELLDPERDADGDGVANLVEYCHGSDPLEKRSICKTLDNRPREENVYETQTFLAMTALVTRPDTTVTIEASEDLVNWHRVFRLDNSGDLVMSDQWSGLYFDPTQSPWEFMTPSESSYRFFRCRYELNR